MRTTGFFAIMALGFLSVAAIVPIAARQTSQQSTPAALPTGQQEQDLPSGYVMKVKTRLVTLDVIAKDSHGNIVRDLKPEELQVLERSKQQKISAFEFVDRSANAVSARLPVPTAIPPTIYSNMVHLEGLSIPPTVLLMDALNTPTEDQMQARPQMIRLLKTLPPNTPIAVFLLGGSLRLVQGFTSNPAQLQAAVDKLVHPVAIEKNPIEDPNSASNAILDTNGKNETDTSEDLENFEKEQYANTIDIRAKLTLSTLKQIARYLSGIQGRKNLIWLSESFPITISPDLDNGTLPFDGTRVYGKDVEAAANALSDAQVAIYPVDLRGIQADQSLAASSPIQPRIQSVAGPPPTGAVNGGRGGPASRNLQGGGLPLQLEREQDARIDTLQTMNKLATETGGQTCANTNDLSGCVEIAVKDGSSYYELGFYPENVKWDSQFHQVVVKTTRRGVELSYRRGYFAVDAVSLAKEQNPEQYLRQACSDLLPSTAIHVLAQAEPLTPASGSSSAGASNADGFKYLLIIDPAALSFLQVGDSYKVSVQEATCDFPDKGDSFQFAKQDLTRTVPNDTFQTWQAHGIPDFITLPTSALNQRVRFAVLDTATGLTGALDVLVRPAPAEKAGAPGTPPIPTPLLVLKTTPVLAIPDNETAQPQAKTTDRLTFHGQSGQSGTLVWTGDNLSYQGDLSPEQSAPAFFNYAFGARFRCQEGALVPTDAASGESKLQLIFWNGNGKSVTVDLKGAQPEYSGDLPVDPVAKAFLAQVWRLAHCLGQ